VRLLRNVPLARHMFDLNHTDLLEEIPYPSIRF
jgi:hypothetical protein